MDNQKERDKQEILQLVEEYCEKYHRKKPFSEGDKINYAARVYGAEEMTNLVNSALDFWLTSGEYTERFEREFAAFLGVKQAFLVNSGSSANLLAFMALTSPLLGERRILRGDEVITVAAGFPTTVTPVIQYGAVPVFVDITIPQYNIDAFMLEKALSRRTKAVMIAHTLGNPFDLKAVKTFCDKHNLWLVEDNCDALGSKYTIDGEEKYTGTIGDIGTSSFYPPHHITMGEERFIQITRFWARSCVPSEIGGETAPALRGRITFASTVSTDSTGNCLWDTIISMFIRILAIILKRRICRRPSAVRRSSGSRILPSAADIILPV